MDKSTQNSKLKAEPSPRVIRASEIGQYQYCARAWWLGSVLGVPSANTRELRRGETAHRQHGQTVWLARTTMIIAVTLVIAAIVVLILALI